MLDFIRVAAAVPNVSVANVSENVAQIMQKAKEAENHQVQLLTFPELALTGYTCGDLFYQQSLLKAVRQGLRQLVEHSQTLNSILAVGLPLEINGQLYNCAAIIFGGKLYGIVPKTYIPTYNEFYEQRWFSSAIQLPVAALSAAQLGLTQEEEILIGNDLIFDTGFFKFGAEICEDLWATISPGSLLSLNGAELLVNLSASNETISKRQYRRSLVQQTSAAQLGAYLFVSAGCTESTTDLIFSGHSMICENGTVLAENKCKIDTDYLLCSDIDLGKLRTDRKKIKTFSQGAAIHTAGAACRTVHLPVRQLKNDAFYYPVNKLPFVPSVKKDRAARCMEIFEMQIMGLKKRLDITGSRPVIGVSGGLDSTLALLVCTEAVKRAGRPLTDVIGITMPCFGTTDRTYQNAITLMKSLGITHLEIPIKEAVAQHFKDIGQNPAQLDLTFENAQARERTQVLMDYAGKVGGFVVGTGDLSELALGWCTYNADHMSMYGVNGGVPKTLVRWMIDSIMENDIFKNSSAVLKDILDTPISPELLPPDETGKIAQQTEEIVGPYALHDFFLYYTVRFGFPPEKIFFLATKAFAEDFEPATIKKWLITFYRRFFSQQFKRSCLPDGVKIGSICLSPRGDWRMPSDASCALWLEQAEHIKL